MEINKMEQKIEKTQENQVEFANYAKDERLVKLNAIADTKMSSLSFKKRIAYKAAKPVAKRAIEVWFEIEKLQELRELESEPQGDLHAEVLAVIDDRIDDLIAERIQKVNEENAKRQAAVGNKKRQATTKHDAGDDIPPAAVKGEPKERKTTHTTHQVGDVHPNGKWVWTEWRPGMFDWKSLNGKYHKTANVEQPAPKKEKAVEIKPKTIKITAELFLDTAARTKLGSKLSAAQEQAYKNLKKGYRVDPEKHQWVDSEGNYHGNADDKVLRALFVRYMGAVTTDSGRLNIFDK